MQGSEVHNAPTKRSKRQAQFLYDVPTTGYLRLPQVLQFVPVSKSTWWSGIRSGRYPAPTRALGERITAWRVEDIRALIEATAPKVVA
jgi:prophage regulatory protein